MSQILIIDDQSTSRMLLAKLLNQLDNNLSIHDFDNARDALDWCQENIPDLVLVDYSMPGMNGIEFTETLRRIPSLRDVPVVMITISDDEDVKLEALDVGATDFLNKPIDHFELRARVHNLLTLRRHQTSTRERLLHLEDQIHRLRRSFEAQREQQRQMLLTLLGQKDLLTPAQARATSEIAVLLARQLGMNEDECKLLYQAAPLYALSKDGISESILTKPGALTEEEREQVKQHPYWGHRALSPVQDDPALSLAGRIALHYRENHDGSGYPQGLKGDTIPLEARIIHLVDAILALRADKPWRPAWPVQQIKDWVISQAGTTFDPDVVSAFEKQAEAILQWLESSIGKETDDHSDVRG